MYSLSQSKPCLRLIALVFFICILLPLNGSAYAAQVTLAWDPNTESDVTGYRIYYGLASDQYSNRIDVGKQTSYTVASLQDGKTYYFAATAYDQVGDESDFSAEVVFNAPVPCTYTVSPSSQSFASAGGAGTVNVTTQAGCVWTAVSNDSWLVITSNSSITGSGTANYSALSDSGATRTGTAYTAQHEFQDRLLELGRRALAVLKQTGEPGLVLAGRGYNIYDRSINCDIPRKLRAQYGANVIPMDFFPLEQEDITDVNPNMYWNSGRRILAAARITRRRRNLHVVYISNFKCGPDSYIKSFMDDAAGKPGLVLQFDGHSNDAGFITRCEAYLDSKGFLRCTAT